MALQLITPPVYIGPKIFRDTQAVTATLDANGEYVAFIIQAPKTGTIARVHFHATTVTADGDGLRVRIETVGVTDGNPSGTLLGGSSEVTIATVTPNNWNRSGSGLSAAVTKGDIIAVKLMSPAAGTTFNGVIRSTFSGYVGPSVTIGTNGLFPYIVNAVPTAAKAVPNGMIFALEYDDGTTPYIEIAVPISSVVSTSFNNGSTPDERGNLFQVPVPCRVIGVHHQTLPGGTTQAYDLVLYDAASSALATLSRDADIIRQIAGGQSEVALFPAPVSLAALTNYRLVAKPTVATSLSQTQHVIDTATGGTRLREAVIGGTTWQLTTRTDGGAWTDTPDTIACLGLIVDQFDDGAGGGASARPVILDGGLVY